MNPEVTQGVCRNCAGCNTDILASHESPAQDSAQASTQASAHTAAAKNYVQHASSCHLMNTPPHTQEQRRKPTHTAYCWLLLLQRYSLRCVAMPLIAHTSRRASQVQTACCSSRYKRPAAGGHLLEAAFPVLRCCTTACQHTN